MQTSTGADTAAKSKTKLYIIICIVLTIIVGVAIGVGVYYGTLDEEPQEFTDENGNVFSWWNGNNGNWEYALNGADVVQYFNLSSSANAVQGDDAYTTTIYGITWRFKDQTNKDLFDQDPEAYIPAYGAHCALAMASGSVVSGDPNAWTVYKGVLYINLSKGVRDSWSRNKDSNIASANSNWAKKDFANPK